MESPRDPLARGADVVERDQRARRGHCRDPTRRTRTRSRRRGILTEPRPRLRCKRTMRWKAIGLAVLLPLAAPVTSPPHLKAQIPTGAHPCGAAAGPGSVWVANYDSGSLVRIDPRRNRVVQRIRLAPGICRVVVDSGSLWVANDR